MGLSAADTKAIEQALGTPDVVAVFRVLLRYPDLRHADLPRLTKAQLAPLRETPRQARGFALGFASPSPSVRRFCKKFAKHAGPHAADAVFVLLLETVDALRPGPGALGEFNGVASPVGGHVLKAKLSTEEPPPPRAYSDAERYGRAVVEHAVKALASIAPERLIQLQEYSEALVRSPVDHESHPPRPWADELDLNDAINVELGNAFYPLASKGDPALTEAALAWAQRELILESGEPADYPLTLARERFAALGDEDRAVARRRQRWAAASLLPNLPAATRSAVYEALVECSQRDPGSSLEESWVAHRLKEYAKRCPGDRKFPEVPLLRARAMVRDLGRRLREFTAGPRPRPTRGSKHDVERDQILEIVRSNRERDQALLAQCKQQLESARAELEQLEGAAASRTASAPSAAETRGPAASEVASSVETLARLGGFPQAWRAAIVAMGLGEFTLPDEAPQASTSPAAVAARPALAKLLELAKGKDEEPVPEAELEQTAAPLLALILELCEALRGDLPDLRGSSDPYRDPKDSENTLSALLSCGMSLLPEEELETLAEWCVEHAQPGHVFRYSNFWDPAAATLLGRGLLGEALFGFVLPRLESARSDLGDQRVLMQLYAHPDRRGRALVLRTVRAMRLPRKADYVNGPPWKQPWQSMLGKAWAARDLELLAVCFERCAVQTYAKGAQVFLPEVEVPITEGYRANSVPSDCGTPLAEVWAAVRDAYPERVAPILAAMLASAEADELPAQLLRIAIKDDVLEASGYRLPPGALLDLLESPTTGVLNLGLELLAARPHHAEGMIGSLLGAAARCVSGTATGPAKGATRVIGELAQAFPDVRAQALEHLSDALHRKHAPVALQAVKSLTALARGAAPLPVPGDVVKRLGTLKQTDAKRFAKPADKLLTLVVGS